MSKVTKLQIAKQEAEKIAEKTNKKINELGGRTSLIYDKLNEIQLLFDNIRNMSDDKCLEYQRLKEIRLKWKQQVDKIDEDYKNSCVKNAGMGAAGVTAGIAVVALGPTVAMGIATTFGVASTGTAISALSGAAATNAALAWLGGGALAVGGGGMAAGSAFLALAGPIGWTIAGITAVGSILMFGKAKKEQARLEDIFTLISKRDIKSYKLAIVELDERIQRIDDESIKLKDAIQRVKSFGIDYKKMTDAQKYELGSYINLMSASTQLLVNPILGLQPKYTHNDLDEFCDFYEEDKPYYRSMCERYKDVIVSLCNLLYNVKLYNDDKKLLHKTFSKNKEFLSSMKLSKDAFTYGVVEYVCLALEHKYGNK